jgi:hypothetical protein
MGNVNHTYVITYVENGVSKKATRMGESHANVERKFKVAHPKATIKGVKRIH